MNTIYSVIKKANNIYLDHTRTISIFTEKYTPKIEITGQEASDLIKDKLSSKSPCMIARFGGIELSSMCSYRYIITNRSTPFLKKTWDYIHGKVPQFWLDEHSLLMKMNAGFFPATPMNLGKFYDLMLEDMKQLDILGSWVGGEEYFQKELENVKKIFLTDIEPYYHQEPWSEVLEGRKILVIHPFAGTIRKQYEKRELLFNDPRILPKFDLTVFPAVQSIAGKKVPYKDWFQALQFMKDEIEKIDFEIAIIGCGAYGFPLAAHIKRLGKKSVHMGGATQLLFGIIGKRWENWPQITQHINEHWIRPSPLETPENCNKIENGCYW